MPLYTITWEIDIDAKTPRKAAEKALSIQRDSNSTATVFAVSNSKGTIHTIDLDEIRPI